MPEIASPASTTVTPDAEITAMLGARSVVLVGMMGAGKSTIGRRLSVRLRLPFLDADTEIEAAAAMSIPDIFETHGEPHFRDGEARVIARLLDHGPAVIATGRRGCLHARGNPPPHPGQGSFDLAQGRCRHHHEAREAPRRPSAAADRGSGGDHRSPDRGTRAGLSACGYHDLVARRAARKDRRRMRRRAACPAVPRRRGANSERYDGQDGRHRMTVPLKHSDPITVDVALGERAYDIVIGRDVLKSLGARVAALRPGARTAIVTDRTVAKYWLEKTEASLSEGGIATSRIIVDEGEGSKTYAGLEEVSEALIAAKIERNDLVIALGGGVVGDLAGFAAAILRRGVDFVQAPTSLLAHVASSVGGKTGINSPQGTNLLGAFHQPVLVIADTAVLDTLSPRQFRAGYAEVAKYGVLGDEAFFAWLEANHADIFTGGAAREHAIATSCRAKAAIVARDERETGERALLNLGHTFGHALEAATGFSDRLFHGEGVSVGMVLAAELSASLAMIAPSDAARVKRHLADVGLPTHLQDIAGFAQEGLADADALLALMAQDKKVRRGKLTFILLEAVGRAVIARDVDPSKVRDFLQAKLKSKP